MKKTLNTNILLLLTVNTLFAQKVPFPSHTSYTNGSILPNCYNQQQLDSHVRAFYNDWQKKYIKNDCSKDEYYVWFQNVLNEKNKGISTSEAQGYGMMITVFMAGYDKNAQTIFNGLYKYCKNHPSNITKTFMAWRQLDCSINLNEKDNNSATDGDFDIAYSLLLAHKQWGSNGKINYINEAKNIINDLGNVVITEKTNHILLGDWDDEDSPKKGGTRTSDFMCNHFECFRKATNNIKWNQVINTCYNLIQNVQNKQIPKTSLFPDFIEGLNDKNPTPAQSYFLETKYDGEYYYNACRVPFRISLHYLLNNDLRAKQLMDNFTAAMQKINKNDPQNIKSGYFLNGDEIKKTELNSSAFIGSSAIASMTNASNQKWLNNSYNLLLLQQIQNNNYFENTLKMLYVIVLSSNWWSPN